MASLYEADIVGYSTSIVSTEILNADVSTIASILGDILIQAEWDLTDGFYTSQQVPWYPDPDHPPSDFHGRIRTDIQTNFTKNQVEFRPQDITGVMKMDLGSIFSPPIRFFAAGGKTTIVASQYQFVIFSDDYEGNPNAAILSAVQIPEFLQDQNQQRVLDVLFACEGDFRRQLWIHGNAFVAVNNNGSLHYWNNSLMNGNGVPALYSNIDANFQQTVTAGSEAPMIMPAMIEWGLNDPFHDSAKVVGFLWDMAMVGASLTRDIKFSMAGQQFQVFGAGTEFKQYGSLLLNLSNVT